MYILIKKMWKTAAIYFILMSAALLISYIIFPHFIKQLGGGNNTYIENLSSDFNVGIYQRILRNIIAFISNINYGFFGSKIYLAALVFIILIIIAHKKSKKAQLNTIALNKTDGLILALSLIIILSCAVLCCVIWIPAARYYYNIMPFISIVLTYIVYRYISVVCMDKLKQKKLFVAFFSIYLGFNVFGYLTSMQYKDVNKSSNNFKAVYPIDYLYLPAKGVDEFLKAHTALSCLFISDYKNEAVTQDIYELMQCEHIYICRKENIAEGVNCFSQVQDNLLIIDTGSGLWGSSYNEEEILDKIEAYGFETVKTLYEKELTKAYIVRFKQ